MKYDWLRIDAISSTIPYHICSNMSYIESYLFIEIWPSTYRCHFLTKSLSHSLKYDIRSIEAISCTIPYEIHRNMTYEVQVMFSSTPYQILWNIIYDMEMPCPLQFLISFAQLWHISDKCYFPYNSSSNPLKYGPWTAWDNWWHIFQFFHFLQKTLSRSSKYDVRWIDAIFFTIPYGILGIWVM